jgi:UDP-N-acetylglucosamine 2-epimerase (non-hydrolysing)
MMKELAIGELSANLKFVDPIGYVEFLGLQRNATLIITDSGGIQEETTFLGVPCLTVRENTERPVTVTMGTNLLVGKDMELLKKEAKTILSGKGKKGKIPPLWDEKPWKELRMYYVLRSKAAASCRTPRRLRRGLD